MVHHHRRLPLSAKQEIQLYNIRLPYLPAISTGYRTQRYSGGQQTNTMQLLISRFSLLGLPQSHHLYLEQNVQYEEVTCEVVDGNGCRIEEQRTLHNGFHPQHR